MENMEKIILDSIETIDGKKKLSCKKAHELAYDHAVSLKQIGEICNQNDIRIMKCELGCF